MKYNDLIKRYTSIKNEEILKHLNSHIEKKYKILSEKIDQVKIAGIPAMTSNIHTFSTKMSIEQYVEQLRKETSEEIIEDIKRISELAKKINYKVVDKVYIPIYNKIGYTLENGDIIFTEEKIEDNGTTDFKNIIRKLKLKGLEEDDK